MQITLCAHKPGSCFIVWLLALFAVTGIEAQTSVTISSPANGSTVTSPVQLNVSFSGPQPSSVVVYDNQTSVLRVYAVPSVQSSLTLTPGTHALKVVAQYSYRHTVSTTSNVTVTTQSSRGGGGQTAGSGSTSSFADQIAADMQGANEAFPHGVPTNWDWAQGPVIEEGTNANGQQAITQWGVIYVGTQGNPAKNTRVNIRNVQTYYLRKSTGKWSLIQNTSEPDGGGYPENFNGNTIRGDLRDESDGSVSVTAGNGYNFHFYPDTRGAINPSDIGGFVAIFQARLIVGNPNQPDDRSSANYLAGSGADYYPSVNGPGIEDNPSVGNGKLKFVRNNWRSYAMTTLTQSQLEQNPPPIDLSGILP